MPVPRLQLAADLLSHRAEVIAKLATRLIELASTFISLLEVADFLIELRQRPEPCLNHVAYLPG